MNLEIAERLIKLRKEKGYSQEKLALELGISRQAISKWERAEASPDTDNLICLARLYGISLDQLLNTNEKIEELKHNNKDIDDSNSNNEEIRNIDTHSKKQKRNKILLSIIYPSMSFIIVIAYLLTGFLFNLWAVTWTLFLLVPLVPSLVDAIISRKGTKFLYPVFVTFLFFTLGLTIGHWNILWVLFITVPLYYIIFGEIEKANRE